MSTPRARGRGSLLIVTLWLIIILGALAVAAARYLSTEVRLTKYRLARIQAQAWARSGLYLALRTLQQDTTPADWAGDTWALPQSLTPSPGWRLAVTLTDEERKLNVNSATQAHLERLLGAGDLVAQLLDYRDAADGATDRPTDQPPYYAKNAPVAVLEELSDLPAMTDPAFDSLLAFTSAATASGSPMNLNTATPEVLRAVGVSEGAINLIVSFREDGVFQEAGLKVVQDLRDSQGVDLTGTDDGNLVINTALFGVSSQTFTVISEVTGERPAIRLRTQAVVRRSASEPAAVPVVIGWREG